MCCQLKHTWCASVQSEGLRINNINCQSADGINTLIIVRVNGMTFTLKTSKLLVQLSDLLSSSAPVWCCCTFDLVMHMFTCSRKNGFE